MRRCQDQLRNPRMAVLWNLPKLGDSIIDTSVAPPSQTFGNVLLPMFALFAGTQLRPEISGQGEFFVSPKLGVFRIMNSITWIYSSIWRIRNASSPESRTVLNTMPV